MNDALNKRIEDLEMSIRSMNGLKLEGFKTVGDLTKSTEQYLRRIPNIGKMSVNEIKSVLKDLGLELGMGDQPQPEKPKTLIGELSLDIISKVKMAFKKSSTRIMTKQSYTWDEVTEYFNEHEKIVKMYREQMYNCFRQE
tara:strand:+ start:490 stop:909 length:420 start_codon:yes stop_codon:yes gene_type:complete